MDAARNEARYVGGIEHEQRAYRIGDAAKRFWLDNPRVGRGPGHDELGTVLFSQLSQGLDSRSARRWHSPRS